MEEEGFQSRTEISDIVCVVAEQEELSKTS